MNTQDTWLHYPMGPQLRGYLGISEDSYQGDTTVEISENIRDAFFDKMLDHLPSHQLENKAQLVGLIDEFVSMDLPFLAIKAYETNFSLWQADDFRGVLSLGVAYMLADELNEAAELFATAQKLMPEEPAPYVNLAQIFMARGDWETAQAWCVAGLEHNNKNNTSLWQLYGEALFEKLGADFVLTLKDKAQALGSWAGISLYAAQDHLISAQNKAELFSQLFSQGERDKEFLVEYTAALGAAGLFDKIPTIVWQCYPSGTVPWQLSLHNAQAHMAMGNKEQFYEQLQRVKSSQDFPQQYSGELTELEKQAAEEFAAADTVS